MKELNLEANYSLITRSLDVLLETIDLAVKTIFLQKISQLLLIFIKDIATPIIVNTLSVLPYITLSTTILEFDYPSPPISTGVAKSNIEFTPQILNLSPTSDPINVILSLTF
jgi:hypothetical protein